MFQYLVQPKRGIGKNVVAGLRSVCSSGCGSIGNRCRTGLIGRASLVASSRQPALNGASGAMDGAADRDIQIGFDIFNHHVGQAGQQHMHMAALVHSTARSAVAGQPHHYLLDVSVITGQHSTQSPVGVAA